jgi:membrane protease subunit HflC
MKPLTITLTLSLFAIAILVALRSWAAVDETRYVLVTEFGRPVAVYGTRQSEFGFHAKWPWQSATSIDRRLQITEAPAREAITGDKRNLEVTPFVVWRVTDPMRFLASARSIALAADRLDERVSAALSDAISHRPLEVLASTEPVAWALDDLTADVKNAVAKRARDELGVEIVDVRLRRFNHPLEVRPAVFELIRSERKQVAATLRAEGEAEYQRLTALADRERDGLLASADADAERTKAKGEAEATRLLNEAHARDPKFYEFLRTLETYRAVLDDKATVILSSASPLFRLLTQGPGEELMKEKKPSTPLSEAASQGGRAPGRASAESSATSGGRP